MTLNEIYKRFKKGIITGIPITYAVTSISVLYILLAFGKTSEYWFIASLYGMQAYFWLEERIYEIPKH